VIYGEVLVALNRRRVNYAAVGGIAVILHGLAKFTADLDLIVDGSPQNIDKLFDTLKHLGYLPRVPVTAEGFKDPKRRKQWTEEKNMKAFSLFHRKDPLRLVDILIAKIDRFKNIRKVTCRVGRLKIPTASIADLIVMKKEAGRPKDQPDLQWLEEMERILKRKK
jgi:hypothetical protein